MPDSFKVFDVMVTELVRKMKPTTFLDIGCGYGKYGMILRSEMPSCVRVGVEVEPQYVSRFRLDLLYNEIRVIDAASLVRGDNNQNFDLVVIGDCIEHMPKSQGIDLLNFLTYRSKCIVVLAPEFMTQNNLNGVDSEAHISVWSRADFAWHDAWAHEYSCLINLFMLRGYQQPVNTFVQIVQDLNLGHVPVMNFDGTQPVRAVDLTLFLTPPQQEPHKPLIAYQAPTPSPLHENLPHAIVTAIAQSRFDDALQWIVQLKEASPDTDPFTGEFRIQIIEFLVTRFNAVHGTGNMIDAERVMAVILKIFPVNKEILNQAIQIYAHLGQVDRISSLQNQLIDYCQANKDTEEELRVRINLARHPLVPQTMLQYLVNMNKIIDLLLCGTLDQTRYQLTEEMLSGVHALNAEPIQDNTMEMYYRVSLNGINLRMVNEPTPAHAPWPEIHFASSQGQTMLPTEVAAWAASRQTRAVFFVAGDIGYVQRFARAYAASVLKNSDVPCLVLVHVIGGAGHLQEVAASLRIQDERLFLSADAFDPSQVQGRCHTTPPFTVKPLAAHFQSARFIWLGYLLNLFRLPIFVTDIDLILQRGVADLLARHAQDDVVLLRDEDHPEYQTFNNKFNARLILLNPTFVGDSMARFFRKYLEWALSQPDIDRFVDQVALTMTHHHLVRIPNARIALFDPMDVNRVLFTFDSYVETPYRFFALTSFINLDMESFENRFLN
ncbi:MAG: class I SAM-dependent methyltransferase [Magnetococcales bacterium]|nr:class I SAM-dependent methyltransferase [Magnetococcales bacterium]